MSAITINYFYLDSARSNAKNSRDDVEEYARTLNNEIITKLEYLDDDTNGYISSAISLARQKSNELSSTKQTLETWSMSLDKLHIHAKDADVRVKIKIETIAECSFGKVGFFETVGNTIYNIFCVDIPEKLSMIPLFDAFIDHVRCVTNRAGSALEDVRDWFKYGQGQYVINVVENLFEVAEAMVCMLEVSSLIAVVPWVGLVATAASAIYLGYTMYNVKIANDSFHIALQHEKNGNLGLAHYYGHISNKTEWVQKHDYGNYRENLQEEINAGEIELVGDLSKFVAELGKLILGIGLLGKVYGTDGKTIIGYDYSKQNVIRNIENSMRKSRMEGGIIYRYDSNGNLKKGVNLAKLFLQNSLNFEDEIQAMKAIVKGSEYAKSYFSGENENWEQIKEYFKTPKLENLAETLGAIFDLGTFGGIGKIVDNVYTPFIEAIELIDDGYEIITASN